MNDVTFDGVMADLPLIAILRGLAPGEAVAVGRALVDCGFRCIEVPLNSPDPFASIRLLADSLGEAALIGAGTVLDVDAVGRVAAAGGRIVISPNCDRAVIAATKTAGMASLPAFLTPSEAFAAIGAGADGLKLFPAEVATPAGLKAMRAVLPPATPIFPVGGVDAASMPAWRKAGASGFGIGSSLYTPGRAVEDIVERGAAMVAAWRASAGT